MISILSAQPMLHHGIRSPFIYRTSLCALFFSASVATAAAGGAKVKKERVVVDKVEKMITINPADDNQHDSTMIMMHGLGDTAAGWFDPMFELSASFPKTKFILPTAPVQPVSLNGGMMMNSWYDIKGLGSDRSRETCEGIEDSRKKIIDIIEKEAAIVKYERVVLAGFSQGGALSLYTGLQLENKLAGILSMSGYLPLPDKFKVTEKAKETPVLQVHGERDDVVKILWAEDARKEILKQGVKNTAFKRYKGMAHHIIDEEMDDVKDWLKTLIG